MKRDIPKCFLNLDETKLLALLGYGEARGELEKYPGSALGVMSVAMTRAKEAQAGRTTWWGKTLREVILKPKQFSCFNPSDPNYVGLMAIAGNWDRAYQKNSVLRECRRLAEGVINGDFPDNVFGATHYNTKKCDPKWDDNMRLTAVIGNHEFFAK